MKKHRWLLLLAACLWAGYSAAAPSYAAVGADSMATSEPDVAEPLVASYIGKTVIRTTEPLALRLAWEVNAREGEEAPTDTVWKLDGRVVSTSPGLLTSLPAAGDYVLELSYRDGLGRIYTTMVTVRAMEPVAYDAMLRSVAAAAHLSLWLVDEQNYLPYTAR
jgi:hypothetical protein